MTLALQAEVDTVVGQRQVRASVEAASGEIVGILGPNGAGKTTLLRTLAGLHPMRRGRIVLEGEVLEDTADGRWTPPERRPVAVVFQHLLLFPHLSVLDNVAFGLRSRGSALGAAKRQAIELLTAAGLDDRAASRPAQLSGGEAQRVALARALATDPRLLLLDEPFGSLDAQARLVARRHLTEQLRSHRGVTLLVTHDPVEAMAVADRLIILEEGLVVQAGTPDEIRDRPRSRYAADLVGLNFVRGRGDGTRVVVAGGGSLVTADPQDGDVLVVVHPRAVTLSGHQPQGSARNVWVATVESVDLDLDGDRARVRTMGAMPLVAEVTTAAMRELELSPGAEVWVSVKATEIQSYRA